MGAKLNGAFLWVLRALLVIPLSLIGGLVGGLSSLLEMLDEEGPPPCAYDGCEEKTHIICAKCRRAVCFPDHGDKLWLLCVDCRDKAEEAVGKQVASMKQELSQKFPASPPPPSPN